MPSTAFEVWDFVFRVCFPSGRESDVNLQQSQASVYASSLLSLRKIKRLPQEQREQSREQPRRPHCHNEVSGVTT